MLTTIDLNADRHHHTQTGETVKGEEAARLGVVLEAVEKDEVVPRALELARSIALNSPRAVHLLMRTLRFDEDKRMRICSSLYLIRIWSFLTWLYLIPIHLIELNEALLREADAQAHSYASSDLLEGLDAIRTKRTPSF